MSERGVKLTEGSVRRIARGIAAIERMPGVRLQGAGMGPPRRRGGGRVENVGTLVGQVHMVTADNVDGWSFMKAVSIP